MISTVKSERHFVEVRGQMLCADIVPSAHDPALQERKRGFDGVGMHQTGDIFLAVIDGLVLLALASFERVGVNGGFVGHDNADIFADVFIDDCADGLGFRIVRMDESQFAIALADTDDDILLAARQILAGFPADIRFVHFNRSIEHRLCLLHRCADSVTKEPCGLVGADTERALNLAGGHTLLGFAEKERSGEPLLKRQMGIVKYRASGHRELVVTLFAIEQMLLGFELYYGQLAAQAARPFGEAQASEQFAALGISREHRVYVN